MSISSLNLPREFGRYLIERKLGQGGMGSVWLAYDTQLERWVALKVPHFAVEDGQTVIARFLQEARVAAGIQHPNLCPVFDIGQINGTYYFTMPYIEGRPLSQLISPQTPCPPRQAASLTISISLAVHELHQRGVVHRDLKPGNVMVRPSGEPVLMDFGLARAYADSRGMTTGSGPVGTPAYLSPEQLTGDRGQLGPASDVYGLGAILFEMLTGRVPFEGPLAAVFAQILHAQPVPPSSLCPGVDADLDAIVLRALAKAPAQRFPHMPALVESLRRYLQVRHGVATTLTASASLFSLTGPSVPSVPSLPAPEMPRHLTPGPARSDTRTGQSLAPTVENTRPAGAPRSRAWIAVTAGLLLTSIGVGLGIYFGLRNRENPQPIAHGTTASPTVSTSRQAPPARLKLAPFAEVTVSPGQSRTIPVRIERSGLVDRVRVVNLTQSPGITCGEAEIAEGGTETSLRVQVASSAQPGPRNLRILVQAGQLQDEQTLTLHIQPAVSRLVLLLETPVTIVSGSSREFVCKVERSNAPGRVEISLPKPPAGLSLRSQETSGDEATLTLTVEPLAIPGRRKLTLLAQAGMVSQESEIEVTVQAPAAGAIFTNSLGLRLALIPAGDFQMGSPAWKTETFLDERPRHRVTISRPFYLGIQEVTVGQFRRFIADSGFRTDAERAGSPKTWLNAPDQTDEHPVVYVSWYDAMEFCRWLSRKEGRVYDLPTEAEWEYACRAGSTADYSFGDDLEQLASHCWNWDNSGGRRQRVGLKKPNRWGLYDMHGNVWEWCADWKRTYDGNAQTDPDGGTEGPSRVLRGGSWFQHPRLCRSGVRLALIGAGRDFDMGFRIVLRSTPRR